MDKALVQQRIDGVPITEFRGEQKPSAGSNPITPSFEQIALVIKKLTDPEEFSKGFGAIAKQTVDALGRPMSTQQVRFIYNYLMARKGKNAK
jgi:hypothetical protein